MEKPDSDDISNYLKDPNNYLSIPMQKIVVSNLTATNDELPHIKLIEIKDLQTKSYPIEAFYKPISKPFSK
jgi:hypothetical protein